MNAQMTPPRIRIRDEADLLALVPYTFGFHPDDSLVIVSLDRAGRPFSARIDLPAETTDVDVLVDQLVFPVRRSAGVHAFLIAYTAEAAMAEAAVGVLAPALEAAGVEVLLAIRAHGSRWWPVSPFTTRAGELQGAAGTPYDLECHELTSRSVVDGRVTFSSRRELAASLEPLGWEPLEAVAAAYDALGPVSRRRRDLRQEARWLVGRVRSAVTSPAAGDDVLAVPATTARLLRAVGVAEVRDVVWCDITRADAGGHVVFWRELVRRSPAELVAAPAGLLAFSAWMAGDGALAWCAVERSLAADPDYKLATLVAQALENATPPDVWVPREPRTLPLYAG